MKVVANDLVPVYESDKGERIVDGRELHEFLQIETRFNDWIERRLEKYGFVEGQDYYSFLSKSSSGGRPSTEYSLLLDVAKELCMVENNEQGSKARKYFIEVERRYKEQSIDFARLSPELQMFKHMFDSQVTTQLQLQAAQKELSEVKETVFVIQETFLQRDENWRNSINGLLNGAAFRSGGAYRDLRSKSYEILEQRASCDLNRRLRNLRDRLAESGATKTKINDTGRMDVIESDAKLKEIYTTIVKEISIGSLKIAK